MRASFKKRLKWYIGIIIVVGFFLAYEFYTLHKYKEQYKQSCQDRTALVYKFNNPQKELLDKYEQIKEKTPQLYPSAFKKYLKSELEPVVKINKTIETIEKKIDEINSMLGTGAVLVLITIFLAFLDFIILPFRNRRLKISTGEAKAMENKKITKITILVFVVWGIISFLIAQSGYRHRFQIDTFLILNIPSILFMGYLWVTDKFTLK